jgi:phage shock protein A
MGIMTRVVKIFKADLHGVMDQLEDQGLLLKQHLRDMEEALNLRKAKLQKMMVSRKQVQQEHDQYNRQSESLENDLTVAVQKNKDDIARMLINKIQPLSDLREELARHIKTLDQEIAQYREHLDQQRLRYQQLKYRSVEYFHNFRNREWKKDLATLIPDNNCVKMTTEEVELELLKRKEDLGMEP